MVRGVLESRERRWSSFGDIAERFLVPCGQWCDGAEIWHALLYLFKVPESRISILDRTRLRFVVARGCKTIRARDTRLRRPFDLSLHCHTALLTCVSLPVHTMQGERINSLRRLPLPSRPSLQPDTIGELAAGAIFRAACRL